MTVVQKLNAQILQLQTELKHKNDLIAEMEIDVSNAITGIVGTCLDLGVDLLDDGFQNKSVGKLLVGITPKLIGGKFKFDKLSALAPLAKKYDHLIVKKDV